MNTSRTRATLGSRLGVLVPGALIMTALLLPAAPRLRDIFWTPEQPTASVSHGHGLAVDPSNPDVLWIGGHEGLYRVTDGRIWRRIGRQGYDMMGFTLHPREPAVMFTGGHPGPRDHRPDPLGVEISRNGGRTWRPLALAGKADLHAMAISPADPRVMLAWSVFGREGLYRSRDGGGEWVYLGSPGLREVFSLAADPQNAGRFLAAGTQGLLVSDDAGDHWRPLGVTPLRGVTITAVAVHPREARVIYAYAMDRGLLHSADGGKTWLPRGWVMENEDAAQVIALDPRDTSVLYVSTFTGDLFRTGDGGRRRVRWISKGAVVPP